MAILLKIYFHLFWAGGLKKVFISQENQNLTPNVSWGPSQIFSDEWNMYIYIYIFVILFVTIHQQISATQNCNLYETDIRTEATYYQKKKKKVYSYWSIFSSIIFLVYAEWSDHINDQRKEMFQSENHKSVLKYSKKYFTILFLKLHRPSTKWNKQKGQATNNNPNKKIRSHSVEWYSL